MSRRGQALTSPAPQNPSLVESIDTIEEALELLLDAARPAGPETFHTSDAAANPAISRGAHTPGLPEAPVDVQEVMAVALECTRRHEAITRVLALVGLRTFTTRAQGATMLVVPLLGDTAGMLYITSQQQRNWRRWLARTDQADQMRLAILAQSLRSLARHLDSLHEDLAQPYLGDFRDWSLRAPVLAAWWHARTVEGYAPEAAGFLLSLTAHPTLSAAIEYDEDGTPTLAATS